MKRHTPFFTTVILLVPFFSCALLLDPKFDIVVAYSDPQYDGITGTLFPVQFPDAATIEGVRPEGALPSPDFDIASGGPVLGVTIASVNFRTNHPFFITGVRIENVRYRLEPADGSPIGTSSDITYVHPVFGIIAPIIANISVSGTDMAVIFIQKDQDNNIDVGLSSKISFWDHIDVDRDGQAFPWDTDESITLTCSLFFEGYLEPGIEFSGAFPPPLSLEIVVEHGT